MSKYAKRNRLKRTTQQRRGREGNNTEVNSTYRRNHRQLAMCSLFCKPHGSRGKLFHMQANGAQKAGATYRMPAIFKVKLSARPYAKTGQFARAKQSTRVS